MVLYGMFSQPYIQYPVQAQAYVRSSLFPCVSVKLCDIASGSVIQHAGSVL